MCGPRAQRIIEFAQDMLESLHDLNKATNSQLQLRIGINTGGVVAGVIGTRKMAYDLWGDAVNVASRMESSGVPGRIQVSQTTFEFLKTDYLFEERGRTEIKGKGTMLTYLLKARLFERTSSGHTQRRSAMTPVVLHNLHSNTSGMKPSVEEVRIDMPSSEEEQSQEENAIEMHGSEYVSLEDQLVLDKPEETSDEEKDKKPKVMMKPSRMVQVMEKQVHKTMSLSAIHQKKKLTPKKNISLPNAVEARRKPT